eukprot:6938743-Prymnesium_polylepis.1
MGAAPLIGLWWTLSGKKENKSRRAVLVEAGYHTLYLEQVINFITFPIISATAFSAFECEEIEADRYFLIADYSVECSTPEHFAVCALAVFFIALHVIGLPLCFLLLLVRAHRPTAPDGLKRAMSFLHRPYRPDSYAWEFVETGRKLMLVGFARVTFETGSLARLIVAVLVSASALTFLTVCRPYRSTLDNYLSIALSFSLLCFLQLCVCLKMVDFVDQIAGDALSTSVEGQYSFSSVLMTLLMVLFLLCGFVLLVLLLLHEVRTERRKLKIADPRWDRKGFERWARRGRV